jgi:hypothetical protein
MITRLRWASKPESLWYITDQDGTRNNIWCGITTSRIKNVQIVQFVLGSLVWTIGYLRKGINEQEVTSEKS